MNKFTLQLNYCTQNNNIIIKQLSNFNCPFIIIMKLLLLLLLLLLIIIF